MLFFCVSMATILASTEFGGSAPFWSRTLKPFSTLLPLSYIHPNTFEIMITRRHSHEEYFAVVRDIDDFVISGPVPAPSSVYPPMPSTITREWQEAQVERMLAQGQGRIEGISSSYDYEKGEFK